VEVRSKLVGKRDLLVLFFFLLLEVLFVTFFSLPFSAPSADLAVLDCVMCSVGGILGNSTARTSILSWGYCSVPVLEWVCIRYCTRWYLPRYSTTASGLCSSNCTGKRLRGTNMLVPAQKWNISSIRSRITIASEGGGGSCL
jgi:hypothetical protein